MGKKSLFFSLKGSQPMACDEKMWSLLCSNCFVFNDLRVKESLCNYDTARRWMFLGEGID